MQKQMNIKVNAFTENDHIFSGYAPSKAYIVLKCSRKIIYDNSQQYQDIGKLIRKSRLERNRIEMKSFIKKEKLLRSIGKNIRKNHP